MEINEIEKLFKSYVNKHKANMVKSYDIDDIIMRYQITVKDEKYKNVYYIKNILENKFKEAINQEKGFLKRKFIILREHIVLKQLIEDEVLNSKFNKLEQKNIKEEEIFSTINDKLKNNAYFLILEIIFYYFDNRKFLPDIMIEHTWDNIIMMSIDLIKLQNETDMYLRTLSYIKSFNVAYAANYFINRGYQFHVENNELRFNDTSDIKKIEGDIEREVASIGGWNVSEYIFKSIRKFYKPNLQRYFLIRQAKSVPKIGEFLDLQQPVGYLLQLSVKYFKKYSYKEKADITKRIQNLIEFVTCYIALFKFQKFSLFEGLFISVEELPYFVQENIFFDRLFTLKQWQPSLIPEVINGLFENLFKEYCLHEKLEYTLDEYVKVTKEILRFPNDNFKIIFIRDLIDNLKEIDQKTIYKIIEDISHKRKKINLGFTAINERTTFFEKPLIKIDDQKYILINASWCSFNFVEALQNRVRKVLKDKTEKKINLENKIGDELESFIKITLKEKGIDFKCGYYNKDDECDLILENKEKVVFIEIKKKMLTEEAQRGNDIKFYDDIAKSLIASQAQLLKNEATLLKYGKIVLREKQSIKKSKGKPVEIVNLHNKKIKKISLSFSDYGFINSREVTKKILEWLYGSDIHTVDSSKDTDLDDTRKYISKMNRQIKEILSLGIPNYSNVNEIFNNSFFMSVQLLFIILNSSFSKDDFINKLFMNERLITGSCDPYFDYAMMCDIKNK